MTTTIESLAVSSRARRDVRFHATRFLLALCSVSVLAVSLPSSAFAQATVICGPSVKDEIVKTLEAVAGAGDAEKLAAEKQIYVKFQFCAQDFQLVPTAFYTAVKQCGATASAVGSLYFEEMSCVGYDPQRRQFAAPIKIKQPFGFGGSPLPGSREHVLHCVADNAGILRPVGHDSVHLSDSNQAPTWQFAVIADANENLQTVQPMNGQTRRARSILSWQLTPTDCNYQPIWGLALNYRIRLDQ